MYWKTGTAASKSSYMYLVQYRYLYSKHTEVQFYITTPY